MNSERGENERFGWYADVTIRTEEGWILGCPPIG